MGITNNTDVQVTYVSEKERKTRNNIVNLHMDQGPTVRPNE